ncbi:hypothetical protein [Streptomyces peucetius]
MTDIFAAFPAMVLARMGADAGFFGFAQPLARREELCQRPAGRATAWASTVFLTSMVAPNTPAYDLRHFEADTTGSVPDKAARRLLDRRIP